MLLPGLGMLWLSIKRNWLHLNRLGKICALLWPSLLFIYSTYELNTVLQAKLPGLMGGGISVLWESSHSASSTGDC